MAETNPLSRQPSSLDYLSPTQFAFNILQLPKVQFNTVSVNIPDISLGESVIPTPFKDIPIQGTSLTYGNLDITFIVEINACLNFFLETLLQSPPVMQEISQ